MTTKYDKSTLHMKIFLKYVQKATFLRTYLVDVSTIHQLVMLVPPVVVYHSVLSPSRCLFDYIPARGTGTMPPLNNFAWLCLPTELFTWRFTKQNKVLDFQSRGETRSFLTEWLTLPKRGLKYRYRLDELFYKEQA